MGSYRSSAHEKAFFYGSFASSCLVPLWRYVKFSYLRSRYGVSTFADSTEGDVATFDDPIVRQAAIRGLGRYNGSVVAIDPK